MLFFEHKKPASPLGSAGRFIKPVLHQDKTRHRSSFKALFPAQEEQLLPGLIHLPLRFFEHVLIALREQMAEASLRL